MSQGRMDVGYLDFVKKSDKKYPNDLVLKSGMLCQRSHRNSLHWANVGPDVFQNGHFVAAQLAEPVGGAACERLGRWTS